MKQFAFAVVLSLAYGAPSWALFGASPAPECTNASLQAREQHEFPGAGYWMQFGGDRYLTYTSVGGTNSQMYDTKARKNVPITNDNYDPFPVPEGDVIIQPEPLRFYKTKDVIAKTNAAKPIYTDDKEGNYQSVAEMSHSGDNRNLRVLIGSSGQVRDYTLTKNGDDYSVQPKGAATQEICRNTLPPGDRDGGTNVGFQLPVMSRDGNMVALTDDNSQQTVIYKLHMPDGNCTPAFTLKTKTNKVSFSFDNKKILFVVKDPSNGYGRLMEYDIASKKQTVLSGPDENVQYQGYKPDGTIMYTRQSSHGGSDENSASDLLMIDPASVPEKASKQTAAFKAVGQAWASHCKRQIDDDTAVAVGSRLKKDVCLKILATQNAAGSPDLSSSCGGTANSQSGHVTQ